MWRDEKQIIIIIIIIIIIKKHMKSATYKRRITATEVSPWNGQCKKLLADSVLFCYTILLFYSVQELFYAISLSWIR